MFGECTRDEPEHEAVTSEDLDSGKVPGAARSAVATAATRRPLLSPAALCCGHCPFPSNCLR